MSLGHLKGDLQFTSKQIRIDLHQPVKLSRGSQSVADIRRIYGGKKQKLLLVKDFSDRLTPYEEAWRLQKALVSDLVPGGGAHEDVAGFLLLVQHPPVYTLGSGSSLAHLGFDPATPPHPLFRTERGGEVTFHGPGQLVMYPIINLRCFQPDLHWYLRSLEEVIIRALNEVSGLTGERIPGLTGVWVRGQKVAAIGVRAQKWVTYHGLAINITTDLAPFRYITPCGIADRPVASVETLLQRGPEGSRNSDASGKTGPGVQQEHAIAENETDEAAFLIQEYAFAMKEAFADIFAASLEEDNTVYSHKNFNRTRKIHQRLGLEKY